ncbi:MAG: hypothetical protein K0V04_06265 [Deltaproteobacteria bacterium]|nr:hypothetical protein [Deltaproteobacteria bacterium]
MNNIPLVLSLSVLGILLGGMSVSVDAQAAPTRSEAQPGDVVIQPDSEAYPAYCAKSCDHCPESCNNCAPAGSIGSMIGCEGEAAYCSPCFDSIE